MKVSLAIKIKLMSYKTKTLTWYCHYLSAISRPCSLSIGIGLQKTCTGWLQISVKKSQMNLLHCTHSNILHYVYFVKIVCSLPYLLLINRDSVQRSSWPLTLLCFLDLCIYLRSCSSPVWDRVRRNSLVYINLVHHNIPMILYKTAFHLGLLNPLSKPTWSTVLGTAWRAADRARERFFLR